MPQAVCDSVYFLGCGLSHMFISCVTLGVSLLHIVSCANQCVSGHLIAQN